MPASTFNASRRICVWLVEDNDPFRKAMTRVINDAPDIDCSQAFRTCEDALNALDVEKAPDVVLMDVGLPGMNGIEGIQAIRERAPSTRVIMLTVFDDHDKIFRAICAGAAGYLLKSSSDDKIREAIHDVLNGGAPMNVSIARSVLDMFSKLARPRHDYGLTARERDILELTVNGLIKKEIADQLGISFHTVDSHLRNIYQKLEVHTRSGAVAKALKERLF